MNWEKIRELRNKPRFKYYVFLGVIVTVIVIALLTKGLITNRGDDWEFKPSPVSSYFGFDPINWIKRLTLVSGLELIGFSVIFALIPVNLVYFNFRFLGFVIRRFKKELYFGKGSSVLKSIGLFILGIGGLIGGAYLATTNNALQMPVMGALVLTGAATIIASMGSILYMVVVLLVIGIKLLRKLQITGLKRKLMWSVSIIFSLGGIFGYFGYIIISNFLGVNLLNFKIVNSGGPGSMYKGSAGGTFGGISNPTMSLGAPTAFNSFKRNDNIGFSTGGAKDINNFRENIKNNYFPLYSDITYEGLFYDYYFDSAANDPCQELFCPAYSWAVSKDPISSKPEYYLSVGLNSGVQKSDFSRKKLNLVIVMDISGSMDSSFNRYYYDKFVKPTAEEQKEDLKTKMQVANESVVALLDHLAPEDKFGMVLFDDAAYLAKPLRPTGETDMNNLKAHILEIVPQGSTNMEAGYKKGTEMLEKYVNSDPTQYENRIIFLTDAQPNTGDTSESGLTGMTKINAEKGIYTTFIGIGVDFNTTLVEAMTKVKGANYYSVHSASEFKNRMDQGFDFMVTPLVFDLVLKLNSSDFVIDKVYGSPEADTATGEIMNINTLFPSDSTDDGVKGGIVILKLTPKGVTSGNISLEVTYKDRNNKPYANQKSGTLTESSDENFQNNGIRKGILLARYANLIKNWIKDERQAEDKQIKVLVASVDRERGIVIPSELTLGEWERPSVPFSVSSEYKTIFGDFRKYFEQEMKAVGDTSLTKEMDVLDRLVK